MLLPDAGLYLLLVLWGGLVAVDGTSCGQFMISRPFVAATVAGLLAGDAALGAAAGVVLEAFHLAVLPVGAARYPEGGPPAVVVGALFAASDGRPSTLLAALLFFVAWEWLAGESVRLMRQLNGRILAPTYRAPLRVAVLERRHLAAVGVDLARGMLLVAVGLPVLWLLLRRAAGVWMVGERVPQVILAATVAALVAGSLRLFAGRTRLFLAGVAGGLLVLWIRA